MALGTGLVRTSTSIGIGILCFSATTSSLIFGVYDARRDANQALILDASLRDSGFVSDMRHKVHLFFGADPNRSGQDYWGESALEVATRRHNLSALDALVPRVNDEMFRNTLIKACEAGNEVGATLLTQRRYPESPSPAGAPCDRLLHPANQETDRTLW